jgi:hypothetical protein
LHPLEAPGFSWRTKETLGNGIVPAVAFATHARLEAIDFECQLIIGACVLTAAVCVMNQTGRWSSASYRHLKGIEREESVDAGTH